jgi:hypothetical protein
MASPVAAQVAADAGSVRILASDLTPGKAMEYCKYAVAERAKVEAFWGPTWTDVIRIRAGCQVPDFARAGAGAPRQPRLRGDAAAPGDAK